MIEGYNSRFSLQGERSSGRPYSWNFENGLDVYGNQNNFSKETFLAYIPSGADDPAVTYADGYSYEQLEEVLIANGLTKYAGKIMPKNTETGPWVSRLDFKFEQEVPGFMNEHKGSFFVSVKNLLNLIDSDSGKVYNTSFYNNRDLVSIAHNEETNQYIYSDGYSDEAPRYFDANRSAWRVKVGVTYKF